MAVKTSSAGAFVKGVDSSTGLLLQPRGSVPRSSNLLMTKRGSLRTCDGTQIVNAYNGSPQSNFGKAMCDALFAPVGVSKYYLRIMKALMMPLGPPKNLAAADGGGSGGLFGGTYFWKVTAVDGAGGETTVSNEATTTITNGHVATLTWNVVPNAVAYNIYRGASTGTEVLISSPQAPQPILGSATVTFTDMYTHVTAIIPPTQDTTQQTAMFQMPIVTLPPGYTNNNIVALWPADARPQLDGGIGGGSGGGGGTGGGNPGPAGSTPSGGFPGNVGFIPQMLQFINQMIIALGNGYAPQVFSDNTGTTDNAAVEVAISSISVDAFGVVTVVTGSSHGLTAANAGACVLLAGLPSPWNAVQGCYQTITIANTTHFTVRILAAIGFSSGSSGEVIVTTIPIYSNFQAQFPSWAASTEYALGTVVIPGTPNGFYYKVISPQSGGLSGGSTPTFPTGIGATVQDDAITWQNAGATSSAAPPPPGAAHISVYAGALWVWDTYPSNTANGLDGPCCLRMSDVDNVNSWNPVNQAFLDKDDGTEGMGLAVFTITAQGIPPEGSLIACKLYATYQIVGVFGSSNFAIQRVVTEMGCLSPRTLMFVPGFGIGRITHLGIAVFDGVADRLISPQVAPYLFPTTDPELQDIVVADANWIALSQGTLTANPAMYCLFIPIGNSLGALTRALCFDLVLKAWAIVDLPFPVSTAFQANSFSSNPITLVGSFNDGTLQRWQSGDVTWATAVSGSPNTAQVSFMVRTTTTASKDPEQRLFCRRVTVVGQVGSGIGATIAINPRVNGVAQGVQNAYLPPSGRFAAQGAIGMTSDMFDAIITGTGDITIDGFGFDVIPKPLGLPVGVLT